MRWTETQAAALGAAFTALDAEGIDWLVLRNHQGLPEVNRSKDVDLGLEKADFRCAESAISKAVHATGFTRLLVEDFQYVRCLTFFHTGNPTPQSIKIDLLDGLVFRGAQLFHFRQLYADGRRDGQFTIPSAADDAVMLWVKPLLTGGVVKSKYLDDIKGTARDDPVRFVEVLNRIFTPDWAQRAWSMIEAGDIESTTALQSGLRKSAWRTAFNRAPFATLRDAAHHAVSEIARRSRRNPATFFAVLGPDGVGKTTFITELRAELARLQVKEPDMVEFEYFQPRVFLNINTLFIRMSGGTAADLHTAPAAGWLSSLVRITYYWLGYVFGHLTKTRRRCINGRTVVYHRYIYDFLVDPTRNRLNLPRWLIRAYIAVTPRPDLVFVLDAEPEVINVRKPGRTREEIARQLSKFREFQAANPQRFVRIDAHLSPLNSARSATAEIVRRLYGKI